MDRFSPGVPEQVGREQFLRNPLLKLFFILPPQTPSLPPDDQKIETDFRFKRVSVKHQATC